MNAEREMSLDEVCAKLPSCHRANKELAKLKAAALSTPQARPDPLCVKALPECQFPKCGCKGEQARPDGGAVVARGVISEATDGWLDCVELTEAGAKLPPGEYQFYTRPAPAPDVALWKIEPEGDTCLVEHPRWGRHVFHAPFTAAQQEAE